MLVPGHVAVHSPEDCILVPSVQPGMTDRASVEFKYESETQGAVFLASFR